MSFSNSNCVGLPLYTFPLEIPSALLCSILMIFAFKEYFLLVALEEEGRILSESLESNANLFGFDFELCGFNFTDAVEYFELENKIIYYVK